MTVYEVMSRFYKFDKFLIIDSGEDITKGEAVTFEDVCKEYMPEERPLVEEALEKNVTKIVAGDECDWVIYCE